MCFNRVVCCCVAGVGELDDFVITTKSHSTPKTPSKDDSRGSRISGSKPPSLLTPGKSKALHSPSPKKGGSSSVGGLRGSSRRDEAEWKEVTRFLKSRKVVVPANAVSRVIGRGGCNINAIREASSANIEMDKQNKPGDRIITIK